MSNARSPREVCSTTIGTSGLTVLASFRVRRLNPARRASLRPARLGASLAIGRGRQSGVRNPVSRAARKAVRRALRRRGLLERLEQLVVGRLDALGVDDRGEHGFALELALGVGLALLDDVV